jgi:hypothetical protein
MRQKGSGQGKGWERTAFMLEDIGADKKRFKSFYYTILSTFVYI